MTVVRVRRRGLRAVVLQLVALPLVLVLGGQGLALGSPGRMAMAAPPGTQSLDDLKKREAEAAAALEDSTAAVQAAGAELARIAAALPEAERQVSVAQGELAGARAKAGAARAAAERAEQARVEAQAEVDDANLQVEDSRDDVARLARRAYQRGRLGDVRDVMDATNPTDLIERGEMLRSVFRAGTASIDRVTDARLVLAGKTAQLKAEEKAATQAREQADAQQARAEQVTAQAEAAVQRVAGLVADRQAAVATAEQHREDDRRSYEQAQAESRALAERIRRAEAEAARRAAAEKARAEAAARAARQRGAAPPAAAPQTARSDGWIWPGNGRLTSRYGYRTHPIYGDRRFHAGIDLGGGFGAPLVATRAGTVIVAGPSGGYGNLIVISHGNGLTSSYAHLSSMAVREGQDVAQGQSVGRVGSTGNVTGPHLHFEIRLDGEPVDPMDYLGPR